MDSTARLRLRWRGGFRTRDHSIAHPAPLSTPVQMLTGVGPKRAEAFGRLGIHTMHDLLHHFPRTHEDRRSMTRIADLEEGESVTIRAEVVSTRAVRLRRRMGLTQAELRDATGTVKAVWFGQPYLARALQPGTHAVFSGVVGQWKGLCLRNPGIRNADRR
jgi:ATP-dependent DNA helicase RecG